MLKNKTIIVTGGAGRLGKEFSKGIVEHQGKVIIADISKEKGKKLNEQLSSDNSLFIQVDTTDVSSIKDLISKGKDHFGKIDAAVHCSYPVSKQWGASFEDLKSEGLSEDLFSQLGGAILFSQQVISYFREQGKGNLIHISSIHGISAPKFDHYEDTDMISPIEYSAIKTGIIGVTKYLAKYCKGENIRVNCISPGGILDNQPEQFLNKYRESCNSKGILDARDILGALIFLLSDNSEYINGQNIVIDDGWSL